MSPVPLRAGARGLCSPRAAPPPCACMQHRLQKAPPPPAAWPPLSLPGTCRGTLSPVPCQPPSCRPRTRARRPPPPGQRYTLKSMRPDWAATRTRKKGNRMERMPMMASGSWGRAWREEGGPRGEVLVWGRCLQVACLVGWRAHTTARGQPPPSKGCRPCARPRKPSTCGVFGGGGGRVSAASTPWAEAQRRYIARHARSAPSSGPALAAHSSGSSSRLRNFLSPSSAGTAAAAAAGSRKGAEQEAPPGIPQQSTRQPAVDCPAADTGREPAGPPACACKHAQDPS